MRFEFHYVNDVSIMVESLNDPFSSTPYTNVPLGNSIP